MKGIKRFAVILAVVLSGCDYLDFVPENDIETVETIFEKREEAREWFNTCYSFLVQEIATVTKCPAYAGADEIVGGDWARDQAEYEVNGLFVGDGLQNTQSPYGDVWRGSFYVAIRYCNIFLEKIDDVYNMEQEEKDQWRAEIQCLKAHYYFELMRRYGPIILVPENIDVNTDISNMQPPRQPIDTCVNAIIELIDAAIPYLEPREEKEQNRWAYYCLEGAYALKAYTLLYAASPLFNGNTMFAGFTNKEGQRLFPEYDHEKWRIAAEAADSAIAVALRCGKTLVQGNTDRSTALLNTMADIENSVLAPSYENDEALLMLRYSYTLPDQWAYWVLPYLYSNDNQYNSQVMGCLAPSIKMVEMYYTDHGLPINEDNSWDYAARYQMGREVSSLYTGVVALDQQVLNLHLRREPRFYAHIAADRCYWQRGTGTSNNLLVEAYQGERFGSHSNMFEANLPQNLTGYWLKKSLYSDIEPINYATVDGYEQGAVIFRLAELYLMKAEAWNEYLDAPDHEHVYAPLDVVRERAGLEGIQFTYTSYANNPNKINTKAGMREIIQREWNIEFAFEGRRFWNLRRWLTAQDELNEAQYGWSILGSNAEQFYNNYEGPVSVWTQRSFLSPRDYLFPIRSEDIMTTGCVQNPGW